MQLPDGEKAVRICSSVSTQYLRVTDRQTSQHGIVRAYAEHRTVKSYEFRGMTPWPPGSPCLVQIFLRFFTVNVAQQQRITVEVKDDVAVPWYVLVSSVEQAGAAANAVGQCPRQRAAFRSDRLSNDDIWLSTQRLLVSNAANRTVTATVCCGLNAPVYWSAAPHRAAQLAPAAVSPSVRPIRSSASLPPAEQGMTFRYCFQYSNRLTNSHDEKDKSYAIAPDCKSARKNFAI